MMMFRVGIDHKTSTLTRDVPRIHTPVALRTLDFVQEFQELEGFDVAWLVVIGM